MTRAIGESVIVITGASSGIGRATARSFAQRGGTVVLAARRKEALQAAAEECEKLGGRALAVPTDVTDEEAVKRLAQTAIEQFGRIDVWINNAAVSLFGRLDEVPMEDFRRVIEVNIFGYVHGARAALPYFREQGSGVLINTSSVVSFAAQPYTSAYVASKAAIRKLSESIRMELSLDDAKDIHVCTVMPATIDTPLFSQAANYTGRATKAMKPVYPPEQVADTMVDLVKHPKREVIVGNAGRMMLMQRSLMPGMFERLFARQVDSDHLQDRPAERGSGNLFQPMDGHDGTRGGWMADGKTAEKKSALKTGLAVAVPAALAWAYMKNWLPGPLGRSPRSARGDGSSITKWLPNLLSKS